MQWSLKRISLTNFRGITKLITLDFSNTPPGLYFIKGFNHQSERLGSNGAGKSSLFIESIIWALTGRVSGSQRPSSDVENRNATTQTSVKLEFTLGDKLYTVERTRNPNSLLLDGSIVQQDAVYNILPLSDIVLRKSVLLGQFGEMFLSLKAEAKSQLFTETLGLDKWIRAADFAGIKADNIKNILASVLSKKEGTIRALDEVWDQYDLAKKGESEFETQLVLRIDFAKQRIEELIKDAHTAAQALCEAQKTICDDDKNIIALNDERIAIKHLRNAYQEARVRSERAEIDLGLVKKKLASYREDVEYCPECGQIVGRDHFKKKRLEMLGELERLESHANNYLAQFKATERVLKESETHLGELEKLAEVAIQARANFELVSDRQKHASKEVNQATNILKDLNNSVNPFTIQCDRLEERITTLKSEKSQIEIEQKQHEEVLAIYQFWTRGFREIRLAQMNEVLTALEITTGHHAETLGLEGWRVVFATDRETKQGKIALGFNVQLYPPGSDEPVNLDSYCGGEIQRWQLAATFGLAEVLLNRAGVFPDFECHDEPTAHLSPEGIEDLLECLSDRARDLQRRIFFIDHGSHFAGNFDGVITVGKDAKIGSYIEDTGGVVKLIEAKKERVILA